MARARNIKPSFFTNEIIGTLDPIVGMTFIGLWCLADKQGRLEDRPLRVKAELFPYREGTDVNGYLTVLERNGFIERYEVDGTKYIQIVNFEKHQAPHHTEKAKGYPSKPASNKDSSDLTVKQPLSDGEHEVQTRSDSLIPDSLIPDCGLVNTAPASQAPKPQKRATQLFPDFYPNESGVAYAEQRTVSLAVELQSFRNFHQAKGSTFKDWQAAWRTWCDKAVEFGRVAGKKNQPQQSFRERDEAAKRKAFEERTGRPWPTNTQPVTIDVTPQPVFLELANEHAQQSH